MTDDPTTPTHWTQFDRLYDLPDPRPYFRGVATGDYRMPEVLAGMVAQILPLVAERSGGSVRIVDFACGYGAVGICLRYGLSMADLYRHFAQPGDVARDAAYLRNRRRPGLVPHRIDGIDIAENALAYAERVGAVDLGHAQNILTGAIPEKLAADIAHAGLILESGAIGDLIAPAMGRLLTLSRHGSTPWVLICPRPRVDLRPLMAALEGLDYDMHTILPRIRYRKPFSAAEQEEEIRTGIANGLSPDDCMMDGYFRVDMRLLAPKGEHVDAVLAEASRFAENGI